MLSDYVIVGSGLTGATISRLLADEGYDILVIERRRCVGGNLADEVHECGIRVHRYGPHYFRTSSKEIWDFVNRFDGFNNYEAVVKSFVNGNFENWPIAASYIKKSVGESWTPDYEGVPSNFEEAALALMPRRIYEEFIKGYTEKQWGVPTQSLDSALCNRFDVSLNDDPRLKPKNKYQGIPLHGYSYLIERMLDGIPLLLNCNYLKNRSKFKSRKKIVFTGPIDEFYNFRYGRLAYRGQTRETQYLLEHDFLFPSGQVNYPDSSIPYIRSIEWKHLMPKEFAENIHGTVITTETPFSPENSDQYEYPFPDRTNQILYQKYKTLAEKEHNVLFCGRLGEYRYYDMDQAIIQAMNIAQDLIGVRRRIGIS